MKHLREFAERMKWELAVDPIEMKQGFGADGIALCEQLAEALTK